ncbi:MAG: hypothetical protein A2505_07935 [Deltaproteobacteria bacterium RIFOXYD12_FULL_55_16]|nr:MAG: hypothetical protein A2505_07935 [Deltaproteobacteria bacterium RIFOXYD12_FULL_55_16]
MLLGVFGWAGIFASPEGQTNKGLANAVLISVSFFRRIYQSKFAGLVTTRHPGPHFARINFSRGPALL